MKERLITIAIFFVIIASSFYFGLGRLSNFSGVDEPYWSYDRVPQFWRAVATMKWKKTNICDKPGIPLAIVSGAGLPFIGANPSYYQQFRYIQKTPEQLQKIRDIYFWLRLPVFLFTLAILPLFYFLIKKLLGKNTARFALLFIGLSPILLGISLIINSDAMLWILSALATLSLFVFFKNSEKKYLVLSGFFLGLSVITKYVANILFVYFFLIFLLEYIFWSHRKIPISKYLKQALVNYLILFGMAIVTAFVFFPATWVNFATLINATIGNKVFSSTWPLFVGVIVLAAADAFFFKSRFSAVVFDFFAKYKKVLSKTVAVVFFLLSGLVFLHVYAGLYLFDLQKLISSPKGIGEGNILFRYAGAITADTYSLLFSISPLVLLLVFFAVGYIFKEKEKMRRETIVSVYILIFIFLYYLGSAVNSVITTVRYQIMIYPLIFVLAAIGLSRLLEIERVRKNVPLATVYAAVIIMLLGSLFFVRPHFLAYASEILPNNYIVNLKGMGEGSFEAANFLNSLPDAQNMTIWSDKGAVCERFVGKCFTDFERQTFENNDIKYIVVSTDRRSRSLKMSRHITNLIDFSNVYASDNYIYNIIISNNPNDFVKIFKSSEFLKRK